MAQPNEILPAPAEAPLPPPRFATAVELFNWIKRSILAQTHLTEDSAEIAAFWVISTWFQDALTILPCLTITGQAHDAMVVLSVLEGFCRAPLRVADFLKGDLSILRQSCRTVLISEPNLNRRSAAMLGNLTNRGFRVVAHGCATDFSMSRAIYLGENPATHKILNSIHITISPTCAAPPARPEWLHQMIKRIPVHLQQYREKNFSHVRKWSWFFSGLSSETAAIAEPLGECIVDAPELRQKLVALLKIVDKRRRSELSNTPDAVVLEATRSLSRDGRKHAYTHEIAAAANLLFEARGEAARLSPEQVGRRLKGLGLPTHKLSQTGNGLTFDRATIAQIDQACAALGMEDPPPEADNLHGSQTTENN